MSSLRRRRSAEPRGAPPRSHLAHAFGLIDAERIDLDLGVARVREAALRRKGDGDLVGRDDDRLAELSVPGTELLLDALERRKLEFRAVEKSEIPRSSIIERL